MSNQPTMSQFADIVSCLAARDRYWQEENAKLRAQLEAAEAEEERLMIESVTQRERAEASEAKLKALDEQEPSSWYALDGATRYSGVGLPTAEIEKKMQEINAEIVYQYAKPIPPADVQELQRDVERLFNEANYFNKKLTEVTSRHCDEIDRNVKLKGKLEIAGNRIAELERKLAERDALFVDMGKHPDNPSLYAMYMNYRNYYNDNEPNELNKFLAKAIEEGRKETVPESHNIREVDIRGDFAVQIVFSSCRAAGAFADAMLAAAPSPASLNAKEGGE